MPNQFFVRPADAGLLENPPPAVPKASSGEERWLHEEGHLLIADAWSLRSLSSDRHQNRLRAPISGFANGLANSPPSPRTGVGLQKLEAHRPNWPYVR